MSNDNIAKESAELVCMTIIKHTDNKVQVNFGTEEAAEALAMISGAVSALAEAIGTPTSELFEFMLDVISASEEQEKIAHSEGGES